MKGTDVTSCVGGIFLNNDSGIARVSIDHCHLDGNAYGFFSQTIGSAIRSITTATNSTANGNSQDGWHSGNFTSGLDVLHLESCSASGNGNDGLAIFGDNINVVSFSNCAFIQSGVWDIEDRGPDNPQNIESRGNNTAKTVSANINSLPPK